MTAPGPQGGTSFPSPPAVGVNQRAMDEEHLRYLSIGFLVWAILVGLFSLLPLLHVTMGAVMLAAALSGSAGSGGPPLVVGVIFVVVGLLVILLGETMAVFHYLASRALVQRRRRTLVFVMAAFACISFPVGTTLGVLTFIVMSRASVKALFDANE